MILPLLQVILTALLIAYAAFWRRQQSKRRDRSWNGIISQLRGNDWGIEDITERFLYKSEVQVTPKDVWARIQGCKGLWAMYKNSPVLVQLADYAAELGQNVDVEMLEGRVEHAECVGHCSFLVSCSLMVSISSIYCGTCDRCIRKGSGLVRLVVEGSVSSTKQSSSKPVPRYPLLAKGSPLFALRKSCCRSFPMR